MLGKPVLKPVSKPVTKPVSKLGFLQSHQQKKKHISLTNFPMVLKLKIDNL